MRAASVALALLAAAPACAEGFATRDLTTITVDTRAMSPGERISKAEPDRVTLMCFGCAADPVIDIQIGRQDDGTEGRIRSGRTTMDAMRAICQTRPPDCTLDALDVGAAVGWVTGWSLGTQRGSTAVIIRDGDLLEIRALSSDPAVARRNAEAAVAALVPQVTGD